MIFSRWNVFLCLLLIFLSFVSSSSLFGGCGGGEKRGVTFNNLNDSPIVCFVLNVRSSRFVAQGHWSYLHPIQWKSNRREWRMGFIRIRQAVNRRIKGEKKKKRRQIFMRITLQRLCFSFSSFVRPWLWGNVLPWMAHPFYGLQICGAAENMSARR